jgi:hypothetical protein
MPLEELYGQPLPAWADTLAQDMLPVEPWNSWAVPRPDCYGDSPNRPFVSYPSVDLPDIQSRLLLPSACSV